jgi:UDP-N-acetylmuramoylalanine--D-glutamate ligase
LGRTGLSCARHLQSRNISFAVTDSRAAPPELAALKALAPDADVSQGLFDEALLEGASEIVASPGVSLSEPFLVAATRRGLPIIGDIELFVREARAPIAAITGTNGKSTVTTLVALMGQAAGKRVLAGGNLGRPALDLLAEPTPEFYVLELSSFQLDTTHSLRAAAATVLNVTPDHMDRYRTLQAYAQSKAHIFDRCDAAIVNLDDLQVRDMGRAASKVIGFSLLKNPRAQYYATQIAGDVALMRGNERLTLMSELRITGLHNAANALAALAVADSLGFDRDASVQALRDFPGLAHRSQWIADVDGVRYVDDSKGTNVGATLAAVAGMAGSLIVIAGGQGKGQDFAPLASAFRKKVRHVVLIGQDAQLIASVLREI